jgi:hypothetical protein
MKRITNPEAGRFYRHQSCIPAINTKPIGSNTKKKGYEIDDPRNFGYYV